MPSSTSTTEPVVGEGLRTQTVDTLKNSVNAPQVRHLIAAWLQQDRSDQLVVTYFTGTHPL